MKTVCEKAESAVKEVKTRIGVYAIILLVLTVIALVMLPAGNRETKAGYKCNGCNVVIIVFDSQRFDHLGYAGYHRNLSLNIDRLAGESIIFWNAYTTAPWTKPSVASLLTSQYPHIHKCFKRSDILPESAVTLTEILSANDYTTIGITTSVYFGSKFNLNQGFNTEVYKSNNTAENLTNTFLSEMREVKQPFFAYLHYIDPHHPYNPPPGYQAYINKSYQHAEKMNITALDLSALLTLHKRGGLGEEDIQFLIDSYDSEIYYADSHVKRVFQHLKENNLWDNTIIIFTADHGEEFSDHKSLAHGKTLYNELLHVPLIIRNPRLSPREVEMQVRVIDIAPTILDALDIPIPDSFQGTSLNPLMTGQKFNPDATVYGEDIHYFEEQVKYFNGEKKSIQTGGWKLIANTTDTGDCIEFELYNINEDPGEKKNVLLENPGVAAVLRKQLMEWANTTSNTSESKTVILTEELLEQLKSLGYAT